MMLRCWWITSILRQTLKRNYLDVWTQQGRSQAPREVTYLADRSPPLLGIKWSGRRFIESRTGSGIYDHEWRKLKCKRRDLWLLVKNGRTAVLPYTAKSSRSSVVKQVSTKELMRIGCDNLDPSTSEESTGHKRSGQPGFRDRCGEISNHPNGDFRELCWEHTYLRIRTWDRATHPLPRRFNDCSETSTKYWFADVRITHWVRGC